MHLHARPAQPRPSALEKGLTGWAIRPEVPGAMDGCFGREKGTETKLGEKASFGSKALVG